MGFTVTEEVMFYLNHYEGDVNTKVLYAHYPKYNKPLLRKILQTWRHKQNPTSQDPPPVKEIVKIVSPGFKLTEQQLEAYIVGLIHGDEDKSPAVAKIAMDFLDKKKALSNHVENTEDDINWDQVINDGRYSSPLDTPESD